MSSIEPFFSIIMPVYNSDNTVINSINSVLKQEFTSWELIIVDDFSSDLTRELLQKLSHPNIKIIYNSRNVGVSESRNVAINIAKGKYVLFLDSDDVYQDGLLSYICSQINTYIGVDLIKFSFSEVYYSSKSVKRYPIILEDMFYKGKRNIAKCVVELEEKPAFGYVWNGVYRRDLIINNNIKFDKDISINEDFCFNINYIYLSKSVVCLSFNGYDYIKTNSHLSLNNEGFQELSLLKINYMLALLHKYGGESSLFAKVFWMYVRFIYSSLMRNGYSYLVFKREFKNICNSKLFDKFRLTVFRNISFKQKIMIFLLRNKMRVTVFLFVKALFLIKFHFPFLFSLFKR